MAKTVDCTGGRPSSGAEGWQVTQREHSAAWTDFVRKSARTVSYVDKADTCAYRDPHGKAHCRAKKGVKDCKGCDFYYPTVASGRKLLLDQLEKADCEARRAREKNLALVEAVLELASNGAISDEAESYILGAVPAQTGYEGEGQQHGLPVPAKDVPGGDDAQ